MNPAVIEAILVVGWHLLGQIGTAALILVEQVETQHPDWTGIQKLQWVAEQLAAQFPKIAPYSPLIHLIINWAVIIFRKHTVKAAAAIAAHA